MVAPRYATAIYQHMGCICATASSEERPGLPVERG
jgi:hypothetical protein